MTKPEAVPLLLFGLRLMTCVQLPITLPADAGDVWKVKMLELGLYSLPCCSLKKRCRSGAFLSWFNRSGLSLRNMFLGTKKPHCGL